MESQKEKQEQEQKQKQEQEQEQKQKQEGGGGGGGGRGAAAAGMEDRLAMMELANMLSVPMALNAVTRLRVADIIWADGANIALSCTEIASRLLQRPPAEVSANAANLERLMRLLASYQVFAESVGGGSEEEQKRERLYALTTLGRTLVRGGLPEGDLEEGCSYAEYVLQHHQTAMLRAYEALHWPVMDPQKEPFAVANGKPAYSFYADAEDSNQLMQDAMRGVSIPFMNSLLDSGYQGFQGIDTLVDVGGSSGLCLRMILDKFPHIRGVNFDLPYVVAKAPPHPGITHVGGNMFEKVPSGDGIFMKWMLTTWGDEECVQLLSKCYSALPNGGKVIACEPVIPETTDSSTRSRALLGGDVFVMAVYNLGCRERTPEQYEKLGMKAGFSKFRVIEVDPFFSTLEYFK